MTAPAETIAKRDVASVKVAAPSIGSVRHWAFGMGSVLAGLLIWQVFSQWLVPNSLFPTPAATLQALVNQIRSGELPRDVVASMTRLLVGWSLGSLGGIVLGLAIGTF